MCVTYKKKSRERKKKKASIFPPTEENQIPV